MRWTKKIILFIICGVLTFSVTSTAYYKSAHAMEWVGGALAFEEALKWLLAAIGITATAGMTDAYWDTYGDDFVDYAIENGATQTEVAEWQLKACQGIIDKGSVVWSKFKAWANDLLGNSSSSVVMGSPKLGDICTYLDTIYYTNFLSYTNLSNNTDREFRNFIVYLGDNNINTLYLFNSDSAYFYNDSGNIWSTSFQYTGSYYSGFYSPNGTQSVLLNNSRSYIISANMVNSSLLTGYNYISDNYFTPSSVADSNFESITSNVDDLDVISSDGVDEDNPEVTIPMPGVSDSDNEASKDAYQDIIDAINDGTITQEQGVEQIQEILKIVTYDTVTDKVVPPQQNEDGTDKTKDDALKENKENMGFTLGGLEAVFPFCIPFDIYAFMNLLVAEPECPEFDFPIKSVNGQVEEIHVDLEPFEPVAVVVRYVFDFLFIIGLAMLTRSLIGGGSSD